MRRFLVIFAWLTWTYRLIVFAGIALAVYLLFFKVLGLFLFAVEIAWFIVRPVWSEAKVWIARRGETGAARSAFLVLLAGLVLMALFVPWQREVSGDAWLHPARTQTIYSPFAARVLALHEPGVVREGAVLVELDSPGHTGARVAARGCGGGAAPGWPAASDAPMAPRGAT
ncbi:MAG: hypothetical protein R3E68_01185 [Burkholderiaceae bacterium]